jgi:hypothetical protein
MTSTRALPGERTSDISGSHYQGMFIATVVVSVALAAMLTMSGALKFSHREQVVETYRGVGVPEDKLNYLAVVLLAGAAGLIVGLFWAPVGVAAAIRLILYFALALAAHFRSHDVKHAPTPAVIVLIAVAALVLRLVTI